VTNKAVDGKTLLELAKMPGARGGLRPKDHRGATATSIPILPNTKVERAISSLLSGARRTPLRHEIVGVPDRATDVAAAVSCVRPTIVKISPRSTLVFGRMGIEVASRLG